MRWLQLIEIFSLTDEGAEVKSDTYRVISSPRVIHFLNNLLAAQTEESIRRSAIELRQELIRSNQLIDPYFCPHPEWFEESEKINVDHTVCAHCLYRDRCTLGQSTGERVSIVALGHSTLPPRSTLQKVFVNNEPHLPDQPKDPFLGYSIEAGFSRELFMIRSDNLDRLIPCRASAHAPLRTAVGFDRETGHLLWPFDQMFLRIIHSMPQEPLMFSSATPQSISGIDKLLLDTAIEYHGWMDLENKRGNNFSLLKIFENIVGALRSRKTSTVFQDLVYMRAKPKVDHPYSRSGSGTMLLAIRWLHLRPWDFREMFQNAGVSIEPFDTGSSPGSGSDRRGDLKSPEDAGVRPNDKSTAKSIRFFPRFPAIAFVPEHQMKGLILEQKQCSVIQVVPYQGNDHLLLIDSLGIDLNQEVAANG